MKKSKLIIASVAISFALLAAPTMATPVKQKPPVEELEAGQSFSNWFMSLFQF